MQRCAQDSRTSSCCLWAPHIRCVHLANVCWPAWTSVVWMCASASSYFCSWLPDTDRRNSVSVDSPYLRLLSSHPPLPHFFSPTPLSSLSSLLSFFPFLYYWDCFCGFKSPRHSSNILLPTRPYFLLQGHLILPTHWGPSIQTCKFKPLHLPTNYFERQAVEL